MVVERYYMDDLDLDKDNNIFVTKTHAEILEILEDIKEYEKKFQDIDLELFTPDNELIEVEDQLEFIDLESEEQNFIEIDNEKLDEFGLDPKSLIKSTKKTKKRIRFRSFKSKKNKIEEKKELISPTTFKLRLNKDGKLVNIDLKESSDKTKTPSFLKKIIPIKGKKGKEKGSSEKESKGSKIKGVFGKIGKLKKAIPNKKKKAKEPEESKE